MGQIVRNHDQLARILKVFRSQGKSVVLTNGCFDVLHVGHVRCLLDAASRGHYLVVAINSDQSVKRLKGAGRPVQPELERAEILSAIDGVDYVTVFDEETADALLRRLRPTALAKGPEYTLENLPEAATLAEIDAELLTVGDPKEHSTRDLLARILARGPRVVPSTGGKGKSPRAPARKARTARGTPAKKTTRKATRSPGRKKTKTEGKLRRVARKASA